MVSELHGSGKEPFAYEREETDGASEPAQVAKRRGDLLEADAVRQFEEEDLVEAKVPFVARRHYEPLQFRPGPLTRVQGAQGRALDVLLRIGPRIQRGEGLELGTCFVAGQLTEGLDATAPERGILSAGPEPSRWIGVPSSRVEQAVATLMAINRRLWLCDCLRQALSWPASPGCFSLR